MGTNQAVYFSYLLRLWPATERGRTVWRASLEDPRSGKRRGFAGLEQLAAFLREQTETAAPAAPAE